MFHLQSELSSSVERRNNPIFNINACLVNYLESLTMKVIRKDDVIDMIMGIGDSRESRYGDNVGDDDYENDNLDDSNNAVRNIATTVNSSSSNSSSARDMISRIFKYYFKKAIKKKCAVPSLNTMQSSSLECCSVQKGNDTNAKKKNI